MFHTVRLPSNAHFYWNAWEGGRGRDGVEVHYLELNGLKIGSINQ